VAEPRSKWFKIRVTIGLVALLAALVQYARIKRAEAWRPDWSERQEATILLMVPPARTPGEEEVLERLKRFDVGDGRPSFDALEAWFDVERRRYAPTVVQLPVKLHVGGPVEVPDLPPAPPRADEGLSLLDRHRRTSAFLDWFARHRRGITHRRGVVVHVLLVRPEVKERLPWQHSVADKRNRAGFVLSTLTPGGSDLALVDAAHELLHLFGARDKYEHDRCVFPAGYAEPFRQPRWPQRYSEVMGQGIPQSEHGAERPASGFGEMRVGVQTAFEVGWIDQARRYRYYACDASAGPAD
jgi:hypothetical protein